MERRRCCLLQRCHWVWFLHLPTHWWDTGSFFRRLGGEGAPLSHCKQTTTDGDVKRWTCAKADKSTDKEQRNYSGFSSSSSWLSGRADEDQKMMKRKKKGQSLDWRDLRTSWMLRHSGLHHHLCGHTTRRLSERRRRGGRRKEFWKNNSSLIWRHLCR